MTALILPDRKLETMELFYPHRKPAGNVKVDWSHPVSANAETILLFNDKRNTPLNSVSGNLWTEDTTFSSTPFEYRPINGNLCFASQETALDGISYYGEPSGVLGGNPPNYQILIFTVLVTPVTSPSAVAQRATGKRSPTPFWLLTSESSTNLKFYKGGTYRNNTIPMLVGQRQIIISRAGGVDNSQSFYSSAKGFWEHNFYADINQHAANKDWIGTGYNKDLPVAFELLISGYGKAPTIPQLDAFITNPYQFLIPA